MTPERFVETIREVVSEVAFTGQMARLREPPGRQPRPNIVRRSEWFNSLSSSDQDMVAETVRSAVEAAVFRFLCLLDGVTALDDGQGMLRLTYRTPEYGDTWLNDPTACELHEALRGDGPPP